MLHLEGDMTPNMHAIYELYVTADSSLTKENNEMTKIDPEKAFSFMEHFSKFRETKSVCYPKSLHFTHMPRIAEERYLNTIFLSPGKKIRKQIARKLRMPHSLKSFYVMYNGMELFFSDIIPALRVFGCVDPYKLLNRLGGLKDSRPPDIEPSLFVRFA